MKKSNGFAFLGYSLTLVNIHRFLLLYCLGLASQWSVIWSCDQWLGQISSKLLLRWLCIQTRLQKPFLHPRLICNKPISKAEGNPIPELITAPTERDSDSSHLISLLCACFLLFNNGWLRTCFYSCCPILVNCS